MSTQNLIQIKRSETTAAPPSLANGELAWSSNGNILYIGDFGSVVPIAGELNPGVLTANQALVANSSGSLDEIRTAELNLASFSITSIIDDDTFASGVSNTSIATSESTKAYVDAQVGAVVSDFTITGDTGSDIFQTGQTLDFAGNAGISTAVTNNQVDIAVVANNGVIANSSGVFADGANGISVTADGINVLAGNNDLTVNSSGVFITDIALGTQTSGDYVENITAGNGLTGTANGEGSTPTLAVGAGVGITVNTDDVAVNANSGLVANTTGLFVKTGNGLTIDGNGNVAISSGDNVSFGDLTVSGDLTVTGNVVSLEITEFKVEDPLIHLGSNNNADSIDLGFVGHYSDDAGVTVEHAGLFRDADDEKFHFFKNLIDANLDNGATTVDKNGTGYARADVVMGNLEGFDATLEDITANSITLTTDLEVVHGGTGLSSVSNNAILYGQDTGALAEATGTAYQVLQMNASGVPVFDSLDGGTF